MVLLLYIFNTLVCVTLLILLLSYGQFFFFQDKLLQEHNSSKVEVMHKSEMQFQLRFFSVGDYHVLGIFLS